MPVAPLPLSATETFVNCQTLCICPLLPEQSAKVKLHSPRLWTSVCKSHEDETQL